jgi:hypothetical protein
LSIIGLSSGSTCIHLDRAASALGFRLFKRSVSGCNPVISDLTGAQVAHEAAISIRLH